MPSGGRAPPCCPALPRGHSVVLSTPLQGSSTERWWKSGLGTHQWLQHDQSTRALAGASWAGPANHHGRLFCPAPAAAGLVGLPWVLTGWIGVGKLPCHKPATLGTAQTRRGFEQQAPGRGCDHALVLG